MDLRAAEIFHRDLFTGHFLDDRWPGNEHLARSLHHDDEIGQCGRVGRHADAWSHDRGDLWNRPGCDGVLKEYLPNSSRDVETFLDSGARRIVKPNHRYADLAGRLDAVGDLLRMRSPHRSGNNGEVLGEHVHGASIDLSITSDDSVGGLLSLSHAKINGRGFRQHELLDECAVIEQFLDTLPCCELAFAMLFGDGLLVTPLRLLLQCL